MEVNDGSSKHATDSAHLNARPFGSCSDSVMLIGQMLKFGLQVDPEERPCCYLGGKTGFIKVPSYCFYFIKISNLRTPL